MTIQIYAAIEFKSVSEDKKQWKYAIRLNATWENFDGDTTFNLINPSYSAVPSTR